MVKQTEELEIPLGMRYRPTLERIVHNLREQNTRKHREVKRLQRRIRHLKRVLRIKNFDHRKARNKNNARKAGK